MSYHDKLARHEALMTRMADLNGADLALAGQVGLVSPEEVFEAAQACMGCSEVQACERHLAAGEPGLPEFCRNGETMQQLARDMADLGLSDF